MTFKLGLTGSIGMGKSTPAQKIADAGCVVWDADAAVHRLYAKGGVGVAPMQAAFPLSIVDGAVSRDALKSLISADPTALPRLEAIVHPLVAQDRAAFFAQVQADIAVFDIPLLYETGGESGMDAVAVVYTSDQEQENRVMARGTMSAEHFRTIRAKQMPASEKRARADYTIHTDTLEHARAQVHHIIEQIKGGQAHA